MIQVKITPVIPEKMKKELNQIASENKKTMNEVVRELLDLGLNYNKEKMLYPDYSSMGKNSILRAERVSVYSSILNNLILQSQVPPEKLIKLKKRAKQIMSERWDYGDEEWERNQSQSFSG